MRAVDPRVKLTLDNSRRSYQPIHHQRRGKAEAQNLRGIPFTWVTLPCRPSNTSSTGFPQDVKSHRMKVTCLEQ